MDMLARGNFNLAKVTLRTPLEPQSVENFGVPQASLEQVDGDKSTPMARLAENSFRDNFQLVQGSKDFFDIHYLDPGIKPWDAEGYTRVAIVSSGSLGSLVDPRVVDDSTAVKTHALRRTKLTFDAGSISDANDEQSMRWIFFGEIYFDGRPQNRAAQGGPVLALQMRSLYTCKHGSIEVVGCEQHREHGKRVATDQIEELVLATDEDTHTCANVYAL
ncbi:microtubule-associated protein RP/EB family member 1-like [Dermacentor silvarum]|uniref:microtubule-associated protein RP/EB family member 1-like n=1 Tax=Dermacentor silvarum TaxID=543639 RepID=UPI00189786D2|nr:microtubule-associated protein RP/EB family member 1-like [Dermacentor silvarum]